MPEFTSAAVWVVMCEAWLNMNNNYKSMCLYLNIYTWQHELQQCKNRCTHTWLTAPYIWAADVLNKRLDMLNQLLESVRPWNTPLENPRWYGHMWRHSCPEERAGSTNWPICDWFLSMPHYSAEQDTDFFLHRPDWDIVIPWLVFFNCSL